MELTALLSGLVQLSRRAGDAIMDVYQRDFDVVTKDDNSPLTKADLASHKVITRALAELTPDIPVLSEESDHIPAAERLSWKRYWLIDPLDGTKEFINRNGEFTVNIALIDTHRPRLGIVHVPARQTTYFGVVGEGAWLQDGSEPARRIQTRQPAADIPVVVGSRSHANPALQACLAPIGAHDMISMGSSLKFCRVAEGSADLYPRLGPTSEWDTAAAQAVVEAAGGQVVTLDGKALAYNTREDILNPWFIVLGDPGAGWMERLNLSV